MFQCKYCDICKKNPLIYFKIDKFSLFGIIIELPFLNIGLEFVTTDQLKKKKFSNWSLLQKQAY